MNLLFLRSGNFFFLQKLYLWESREFDQLKDLWPVDIPLELVPLERAADDVVEAMDYDEVLDDVNWELSEVLMQGFLMKMIPEEELPMIPKEGESYLFPRTLAMPEVSMEVEYSIHQVVFADQWLFQQGYWNLKIHNLFARLDYLEF